MILPPARDELTTPLLGGVISVYVAYFLVILSLQIQNLFVFVSLICNGFTIERTIVLLAVLLRIIEQPLLRILTVFNCICLT